MNWSLTRTPLDVALHAAKEAGKRIKNVSQSTLSTSHGIRSKSMFADLITTADIVADEKIREILTSAFPDYGILSEEGSRTESRSELQWIIDPLDGTIAYATGLPHFGVSIGLVEGNQPIMGVLHFPLDGTTYWAQRGMGAYLGVRRIKVSKVSNLHDAVIGMVYGFKDREESMRRMALPLVEHTRYVLTYPCTTFLFALVASGRSQGCIHFWGAAPWDLVAGSLLVEEAGGKVTSIQGEPVDLMRPENSGVLATNGAIHDQVLHLLAYGRRRSD